MQAQQHTLFAKFLFIDIYNILQIINGKICIIFVLDFSQITPLKTVQINNCFVKILKHYISIGNVTQISNNLDHF